MMIASKLRASERGVALVEFAVALPLLIMLLIGLIEYGRLAYFSIEVSNAAHAGAQYASLKGSNAADTSGIKAAVTDDGKNSIATLSIVPSNPCACWNGTADTPSPPTTTACQSPCTSGTMVIYAAVQVTGAIQPLFNYSWLGLPAKWTVTRTAYSQYAPL